MESKSSIVKLVVEKHAGFLLGLILLGLALVYFGAQNGSNLLIAVGGSLFGGGVSSFIAKLDGDEFQNKTLAIITESLDAKLISEESKIKKYRQKWHFYYRTSVEKRHQWRHVLWDFQEVKIIGQLTGVEQTVDLDGETVEYIMEGVVRDNRLVVFDKAKDSDEIAAVIVIPFMGDRFYKFHPGLQIHKTWDGGDSISPVLISKTPLSFCPQDGIIDETYETELDQLWKDNMLAQTDVFKDILN